jgi:hypothetical protein
MLDVAGDLTIHGITKHVTVPVRFLGTKQMQGWGDFIGFDTEFTIDRTEFGVNGGSSWSLGAIGFSIDPSPRVLTLESTPGCTFLLVRNQWELSFRLARWPVKPA